MTRGILALLTFAATLAGQPARAAEPPMTVYEITRARPGGSSAVPIYVLAHSDGEPGLVSFLQLAPRKGGGWTRKRFSLVMYNPSDTRFAAYGPATTPPVPCSASQEICGAAGKKYTVFWVVTFQPAAGNRYLLAGPSGKVQTFVPPGWRARKASLGARVVTGPGDADAVGAVHGGGRVEAFHSATAPGGKYGSGAFAMVPCDGESSAGSATVKSDGSDAAVPISCEPRYDAAFSGTLDGRTWTVAGPVVGEYVFPYRLFVFDYPKR